MAAEDVDRGGGDGQTKTDLCKSLLGIMAAAVEELVAWSENGAGEDLRTRCKLLFTEGLNPFYDVAVKVARCEDEGERTFMAHKLMLGMSSVVLASRLYVDQKATEEVGVTVPVVEIRNVKPSIVKLILEFIYTEDVRECSALQIGGLLHAAKLYNIPTLVEFCRRKLEETWTCEDVIKIFQDLNNLEADVWEASKSHYVELLKYCCTYILRNGEVILRTTNFMNLTIDCISSIIKSDFLDSEEITVYNALKRWAKFQCNKEGVKVNQLENYRKVLGVQNSTELGILKLVRFPCMDSESFTRIVNKKSGCLLPGDVCEQIYEYYVLGEWESTSTFSCKARGCSDQSSLDQYVDVLVNEIIAKFSAKEEVCESLVDANLTKEPLVINTEFVSSCSPKDKSTTKILTASPPRQDFEKEDDHCHNDQTPVHPYERSFSTGTMHEETGISIGNLRNVQIDNAMSQKESPNGTTTCLTDVNSPKMQGSLHTVMEPLEKVLSSFEITQEDAEFKLRKQLEEFEKKMLMSNTVLPLTSSHSTIGSAENVKNTTGVLLNTADLSDVSSPENPIPEPETDENNRHVFNTDFPFGQIIDSKSVHCPRSGSYLKEGARIVKARRQLAPLTNELISAPKTPVLKPDDNIPNNSIIDSPDCLFSDGVEGSVVPVCLRDNCGSKKGSMLKRKKRPRLTSLPNELTSVSRSTLPYAFIPQHTSTPSGSPRNLNRKRNGEDFGETNSSKKLKVQHTTSDEGVISQNLKPKSPGKSKIPVSSAPINTLPSLKTEISFERKLIRYDEIILQCAENPHVTKLILEDVELEEFKKRQKSLKSVFLPNLSEFLLIVDVVDMKETILIQKLKEISLEDYIFFYPDNEDPSVRLRELVINSIKAKLVFRGITVFEISPHEFKLTVNYTRNSYFLQLNLLQDVDIISLNIANCSLPPKNWLLPQSAKSLEELRLYNVSNCKTKEILRYCKSLKDFMIWSEGQGLPMLSLNDFSPLDLRSLAVNRHVLKWENQPGFLFLKEICFLDCTWDPDFTNQFPTMFPKLEKICIVGRFWQPDPHLLSIIKKIPTIQSITIWNFNLKLLDNTEFKELKESLKSLNIRKVLNECNFKLYRDVNGKWAGSNIDLTDLCLQVFESFGFNNFYSLDMWSYIWSQTYY